MVLSILRVSRPVAIISAVLAGIVFRGQLRAQGSEEISGNLTAMMQYDRTSLTLIPSGISPQWQSLFESLCADGCMGLPVGNRFDINQVGSSERFQIPNLATFWDPEEESLDSAVAAQMQAAVATRGLARSTIRHLYSADENFTWSLDRLVQRALYGATASDAIQTIASERGVTGDNASELVTRTYFLVFGFVDPEVSVDAQSVENPLTGTVYTRYIGSASAKPFGVLLKLNYPTRGDVLSALSDYFCGSSPADCGGANDLEAERTEREAAFAAYAPPVSIVGILEPSEVSTASTDSDQATARRQAESGLLAAIFDALVDDAVRLDPSLRVRTPVVATGPVAARIGSKEGLKKGRRYFVFRRTQGQDGEIGLDRRGVVRASSIVDNRQNVVEQDAQGRQVLAIADSSLFLQTFGKGINRFDVLEERPDFGVGISAGGAYEGALGAWGRVDYRLLSLPGLSLDFLPLGSMIFVEGVYSPSVAVASGLDPEIAQLVDGGAYLRTSFGLSNEIYLAQGNLRVGAEGSFGLVSLDAGGSSPALALAGLKVGSSQVRLGAYGGFAFSPEIEVVGRAYWARAGGASLTDEDGNTISLPLGDWTDFSSAGTGIGFAFGVRYAF